MPLFNLICKECNHEIVDKLCSYDTAKSFKCPECTACMKIKPVKNGGFRILGASAENGYTMDYINYDGSRPDWSGDI